MTKRMRKAVTAVGLAVAPAAGTVVVAGSVSAAPAGPAAYNGVCGAGYEVVDSADLEGLGTWGGSIGTYSAEGEGHCGEFR